MSSNRLARVSALCVLALLFVTGLARAQAPPGYYDTVDPSTPETLRATLHEVIDDHTRIPYTSSSTDTWDVLELADEDPNDPSSILDLYKNASYPKFGGGNSFYNREHAWPKSYGFPNDSSSNYPYTDCHHLFLCDSGYNSSRSNKPYRFCDAACTEKPTDLNFGQGGGSGVYPGNSNWTSGSFTSGTWETWIGRRGDVARALFYMDVRYEGGVHGITGANEPDLILTDDEALIAASNTGANESVAYMGMLSVLLQWHQEDPVDSLEMWHNDRVFDFQGNRNPFVDHPEWVDCLFAGNCTGGGDTTPPAAPTGLVATGAVGSVDLSWNANSEPDLAGYLVYRSDVSGGPYALLTASAIPGTTYSDTTATGTGYYVVTAVDTSTNESGFSNEAAGAPTGGGGGASGDPWINEFHYDNASTDVGEFVEIAGPAGTDLSGWTVVGYNGNGGGSYKTVNLAGVLPDQGGCLGALDFAFSSMQNGAPDGLALVDPAGTVVQFLSYEGTFTATDGPASGMTSVDVGVAESSSTPAGHSLQLGGTGGAYADFTWQAAQAETRGLVNTGQTFDGCGGAGPVPPASPMGLVATAGDGEVQLTWDANTEPDLLGYDVHRSTTAGGPYTRITASPLATPGFTDTGLANGTTYFYVVTALDTEGLESAPSNEANATPLDLTPPAAPAGLAATAGDGVVDLDWADNGEADLAGYHVYRATTAGGPYTRLTGSLLVGSLYSDAAVVNGTTYFYVVTASDAAGNESAFSLEVAAQPQDVTPPAAPTGLTASAGDGVVDLDWADNAESDLAGYHVYRATSAGGPYTRLTTTLLSGSLYSDGSVANGTTYYYVVSASDAAGNESAFSAEVSATPQAAGGGGGPVTPWINELHYDNSGKDRGEFVEIAGAAGTDLSGWTLVGYNGNGGSSYKTVSLSGTIPDQQAGFGTLSFSFKKLQNGAPDGIALVDASGTVVEFLSYEGAFTATNGPAAGMASIDIGVSESSSTPRGYSLQLAGTGSAASDFSWQPPQNDTPGAVNAGQTFTAP